MRKWQENKEQALAVGLNGRFVDIRTLDRARSKGVRGLWMNGDEKGSACPTDDVISGPCRVTVANYGRTSRGDILSNNALFQGDATGTSKKNHNRTWKQKLDPVFASSSCERAVAICMPSMRDVSNFSECQSSVYEISTMLRV